MIDLAIGIADVTAIGFISVTVNVFAILYSYVLVVAHHVLMQAGSGQY